MAKLLAGLSLITALVLTSCETQQPVARITVPRTMVGVLTFGASEGSFFQECPLIGPWNCFESASPKCAFKAEGQAFDAVEAAVDKAGSSGNHRHTYGVTLIGSQVQGATYGHLSRYDCEVRATSVQMIEEVPSFPPEL